MAANGQEDRIFAYVPVSVQLIFPFQEALGEIYTYILCTLSIVFFSLDGSYARESGDPDRKREALDLAEFTRRQPWWRKLFGPESGPSAEKYSAATQLAVGGVTGWCTGLVFRKVGKLAATALGGGFFLLQLASHTGYIRVDWQRLEKDVKKAKAQLKIHRGRQMPTEVGSKAEEALSFVKKNVPVAAGFLGGFLLGLAS